MDTEKDNIKADFYIDLIGNIWNNNPNETDNMLVDKILELDLIDPFKLINNRKIAHHLNPARIMQIKKYYNITGMKGGPAIPCDFEHMNVLIEMVDERETYFSRMLEQYLLNAPPDGKNSKGVSINGDAVYYLSKLQYAKKRKHMPLGRINCDEQASRFYNICRSGKGVEYTKLTDDERELWKNSYNYSKYSDHYNLL